MTLEEGQEVGQVPLILWRQGQVHMNKRKMGRIADILSTYKKDWKYFLFFIVLGAFFLYADYLNKYIDIMIEYVPYASWHAIMEISSILVSFSVFVVTYYTYDQSRLLRPITIGNIFLFMGIVDLFHTLSYEGMPAFLTEIGCCANRATTFWVAARLFGSLGLMITSFLDKRKKSRANKLAFLIPTIALSFAIMIIVIYYPGLLPPMYKTGTGLTDLKIILEYVVIACMFTAFLRYIYEYRKTKDRHDFLLSAALLVSIFSELSFTMYDRVDDIYNFLGHIFKVVSFFMIFRVKFIYSVNKPYHDLYDAQKSLEKYADDLDRLVEQRTAQLKDLNNKLMDDLNYARDIQKSLLPSHLPSDRDIAFYARYYPADRVSGDFYDVIRLDEDNIGLYIGDVSGHGVPAAMLTVFLKQSIEVSGTNGANVGEIYKPSQVLKSLYRTFNQTNLKDDIYIVMLYAVYNVKTKEFVFSSAGLNTEPLFVGKEVKNIEITGFPICKLREFYEHNYEDMTITLNKGDRLILYTDGLIEAANPHDRKYSKERLVRLLAENINEGGSKVADAISDDLFQFTQGKDISDDITYIVIEAL